MSKDARIYFLAQFTKQLIINSTQRNLEIDEDIIRRKVRDIVKKRQTEFEKTQKVVLAKSYLKKPLLSKHSINSDKLQLKRFPRQMPLPPTIQHIRPVPQYAEINLGKLNPLIRDITFTSKINPGVNTNIQVRRGSEKRNTQIILTLEEIRQILEIFAQESRIPFDDFYKVVVGSVMISAVDPLGESPRIIITKIH